MLYVRCAYPPRANRATAYRAYHPPVVEETLALPSPSPYPPPLTLSPPLPQVGGASMLDAGGEGPSPWDALCGAVLATHMPNLTRTRTLTLNQTLTLTRFVAELGDALGGYVGTLRHMFKLYCPMGTLTLTLALPDGYADPNPSPSSSPSPNPNPNQASSR